MKKRDENMEINIGDRIPYVMITGAKGSKNYENAEDPIKVLEEDLPIDYDYYINKQIRPPLERLLKNTNVVKNFDMLFSGPHTKVRYIPKINEKSALGSFLKKSNTCEGCKRECMWVFCSNCEDPKVEIYLQRKDEVEELKAEMAKLNT
jgi:DNA polymerase delta subunit 1